MELGVKPKPPRKEAGPRYARRDGAPDRVRWGRQRGSVYLLDQKVPVQVPRVRDRRLGVEVPLESYRKLQQPRAADEGMLRRVLYGLSCRDYLAAAEAVPEAFGLSRSSVSCWYIRASVRKLEALQERRLDRSDFVALAARVEAAYVRGDVGGAPAVTPGAEEGERGRRPQPSGGAGGDVDLAPAGGGGGPGRQPGDHQLPGVHPVPRRAAGAPGGPAATRSAVGWLRCFRTSSPGCDVSEGIGLSGATNCLVENHEAGI